MENRKEGRSTASAFKYAIISNHKLDSTHYSDNQYSTQAQHKYDYNIIWYYNNVTRVVVRIHQG